MIVIIGYILYSIVFSFYMGCMHHCQ